MANVKISELPVATSLSNGDSFPVVQGGVTKQAARSVLFASPTFTGTTTADLLTATGDVTFDGGAFVFNESGADKDARFEGDTDANLLFLDASTDRVGIGTAAPAAKLDVNGNTSVTGNVTLTGDVVLANDQYLYWGVGDGSAYVRGNSTSDYVSFGTVGVERMRLDSSGNVGIGTASAGSIAKLAVSNTGTADNNRLGVSASNYLSLPSFTASFLGQGDISASGTQCGLNNASLGYLLFQNTTAGLIYTNGGVPLVFGTSGNERMRLDSSGNVGIGTTSPAGQLHLAGTNAQQIFRTDQSTSGYTYTQGLDDTGAYFLHNSSARSFRWAPNSVTRMELDASGNLFCQGVYNNTSGSAANVFVASNGLLQRSTSSIKYKTDIQDATHGLADVMRLRPVTYKGKNDGDRVFGGLIAEEVHSAGLTEFVQYADDGSPDALAYGNMVSLLTKAIQEQQAIINELRARVAALEAG